MTKQKSNKPNRKIHIILQGKGGVGKTLISNYLSQYINENNKEPLCFDTDPINHSFLDFKSLNVVDLNIIKDNQVDPRQFDVLMEKIIESENDVVIDSGATTFINLLNYIYEYYVLKLFKEYNIEPYIHVVLSGGQDTEHTFNGLNQMIKEYKLHDDAKIVVWKNTFHGDLILNNTQLNESDEYRAIKKHIFAEIELMKIPINQKSTFGIDIEEMLSKKITFNEAISSNEFTIMSKQRLKILKQDTFERIANANL